MLGKSVVVGLLLLIGATALADQTTKQAKLQELMELQGLTAMIEQQRAYCQEQARQIGPRIIAEFKKQIPNLDTAVLAEMEVAASTFIEAVQPTWTPAEAADAWTKYYGEQLTEEDLDQIVPYYRSPAGQKDVAASSKAMPGWTAFFTERNNKAIESAMSVYVERLKAIVQRAVAKKKSGQ